MCLYQDEGVAGGSSAGGGRGGTPGLDKGNNGTATQAGQLEQKTYMMRTASFEQVGQFQ